MNEGSPEAGQLTPPAVLALLLPCLLARQLQFAKMYLEPYPFHAVVIYDDSEDYAFLHDPNDLAYLWEVNNKPEVVSKRDIRARLRALSDQVRAGLVSCRMAFFRGRLRLVPVAISSLPVLPHVILLKVM